MNQTIDVRDLMVGSLVLDEHGRMVQLRAVKSVSTFDGCGLYTGFTFLGEQVTGVTETLKPLPVTLHTLQRVGIKQRLGELLYCHREHNWLIQLPASEDHDVQLWDGEWHTSVTGIHHLQALVWHLEQVWLTIETEEEAQR